MIRKTNSGKTAILFLVAAWATTAAAQTRAPRLFDEERTLTFGFVSPNTRDNLKINEAIRNLASAEESNLIRQAGNIACRVRTRLLAVRALGSWSDGAEHSVLLRINADEATIRYLLSKLGQVANQKTVLYFHRQPTGSASIYILHAPKRIHSLKTVARLMDQAGVSFRTLVPTRKGVVIYVVDLKGELQTKVVSAARRLKAQMRAKKGDAEFIGDDSDRQKAGVVFQQAIGDYETKHPNMPATCREARMKDSSDSNSRVR